MLSEIRYKLIEKLNCAPPLVAVLCWYEIIKYGKIFRFDSLKNVITILC